LSKGECFLLTGNGNNASQQAIKIKIPSMEERNL